MKHVKTFDLPEMPTSHSGVGKKRQIINTGEVPHLHQFGRVTFQPGEVVTEHSHEDFSEIMYIEEGQGDMKVDNETFQINKGSCITVSPNEKHTITVTGDKPLTLLFFGIYTK